MSTLGLSPPLQGVLGASMGRRMERRRIGHLLLLPAEQRAVLAQLWLERWSVRVWSVRVSFLKI